MDTKVVNLFVFDTKENYKLSKDYLGEEGLVFKRMICIENGNDFEAEFKALNESDYICLVVHVFATQEVSGVKKFLATQIAENFPKMGIMYITDKNEKEVSHQMVDAKLPQKNIFKYHEVVSNIRDDKIGVYTKKQILESLNPPNCTCFVANFPHYPQIDYAVITALYNDEFQEIEKVFDFPRAEKIETEKKIYHIGYLKSDHSKKIVAAIPNATGMVDTSIIATQMLELFRPKYLLMSGVCGGGAEYNFGDIIVAKQVFTFQKGKLSDTKIKNKDGEFIKIDLYDKENKVVDYEHLYDNEGNQIAISIEKFEIEHDSIINLDTLIEDKLIPRVDSIKNCINRSIEESSFFKDKVIKIDIAPIACSTMVINKEGFFEDTIKIINRKTAAVEMESYGVARACQFANRGKTIPIIFKAVMDNTKNKTDVVEGIDMKKFAAYTSAQFLKCLFEEKII